MKPRDSIAVPAVQRAAFDASRISIVVQAHHALALSHWARAARAWAKNDLRKAGSELKAAAGHAEHAAAWLGGELAGMRADKLKADAGWTCDEIKNASIAVNNAIDAIAKQIGSLHKALPFDHLA
jgi:hypothetical protein